MPPTAIIYTRYSTENQRDTSTEDQERLCRQRAELEGWAIAAAHYDKSTSGTTPVASRPGGSKMLADLLAGRAEILLIESLDRLSRDILDAEATVRRLEYKGVRIVGIADGYDTATNPTARAMQRGLRGIINQIYVDDIRAKTHRGLAGQVERGCHAGGKAYGYRTIQAPDGRRLEIDPEQAEVVRWIYARYAEGWSAQRIVADLNARRVPSPRGSSWAVGAIYGSPAKGTGILNNELFAGIYHWNRSQFVKDPETHKRHRIERPKEEWKTAARPDLRIIDPGTWTAVRQRLESKRGTTKRGKPASTLFGGLMICSLCGGAIVAVNHHAYGCANRNNRGKSICAGIYIPRKITDSRLLGIVREDLLSPAALAEFHAEMKRMADEFNASAIAETKTAADRKAAIQRQIDNLVEAITATGYLPSLGEKLKAAEVEMEKLKGFEFKTPSAPAIDPSQMLVRYKRKLMDLQEALTHDIPQARQILKEFFGRILVEKQEDGIYARINENAAGLLSATGGAVSINVVAGTRYANYRRIKII